MRPSELLAYFCNSIPNEYPKHMLCFFAAHASKGNVLPFTFGLLRVLGRIEDACAGYSKEMIDRMAAIDGTGERQYETLLQILAEIYVTGGAVEVADRDENGRECFTHEPGTKGQKNPEFETCSNGIWYAVEVKTPQLVSHSRNRHSKAFQLTARLPREATDSLKKTLPRDNPVKDFLISANDKFQAYTQTRPDAYRILTIVWDDFCYEPVAALLHPQSGLLTSNSFYKDSDGVPVTFPWLDGVIVCRYQHQIIRATREEPLMDGEGLPFVYHHYGFPPKVLIANPAGREIPEELLEPLNAQRHHILMGAEYNPTDLVMWMQEDDSDSSTDTREAE